MTMALISNQEVTRVLFSGLLWVFKSFDLESKSLHECIRAPCAPFVLCQQKQPFDIHTGPA